MNGQNPGRQADGAGGIPGEETFKPTSGRVSGVLGLAGAALVVVLVLAEGVELAVAGAALLAGVLVWAAVLRPGLAIRDESLVMRNMLETVTIPLAAIEQVRVEQFTAVSAGGRRYVSPAIGRTLRQMHRRPRDPHEIAPHAAYPSYVEDRIRERAAQAAAEHGVRRGTPEQAAIAAGIRREPARVEIALVVVAVLVLLGTLLV